MSDYHEDRMRDEQAEYASAVDRAEAHCRDWWHADATVRELQAKLRDAMKNREVKRTIAESHLRSVVRSGVFNVDVGEYGVVSGECVNGAVVALLASNKEEDE